MSSPPQAHSKPRTLDAKRKAAEKVLRWHALREGIWQVVFLGLLGLVLFLAGALVAAAADHSQSAVDLGSRLFGDAEEAAWLGWLTYFGWLFFDRMNRARKRRRSARLARLLLRRRHPKWHLALIS